jgi:peptide/nickel transport system substrate-binding protein
MIGARLLAGVLALALVGSACTSDSPVVTPTDGGAAQTSPPPRGGSAVFGAEVWPECLNPIIGCAAEPWTHYTVLQHALPRAMELDPAGNYTASPLLVEAPSLENGGLDPGPPFRIAFRIRSEAVWDDGSAITAEDFAFTWRAIMTTPGSIWRETYGRIESIDTSDPKTVVITLGTPWAGWPELFGGAQGFLLESSSFPELSDSDSPDLNNELLDAIPFSGGPFRLASWTEEEVVLVRNERFFGIIPSVESVRFVPLLIPADRVNNLFTGKVSAIFTAQPVELPSSLGPNLAAVGADGTEVEALWFNQTTPPLDDRSVREALAYAIDRETLVKRMAPQAGTANCGFVAIPGSGPWCELTPFDRFTYNPGRSHSILEAAGYECSGRPCTKGGNPLAIEFTVAPSGSRAARIIRREASTAGFDLRIRSLDPGCFGCDPTPGTFQLAQYSVSAIDPSVTSLFGCDQIPAEDNGFAGQNRIGWCNREADALMRAADVELDEAKRVELMNRVQELQAEDVIGLPLYVRPVLSLWRRDQVAGPIGLYSSTPYGMFFNLNEWYVPR